MAIKHLSITVLHI